MTGPSPLLCGRALKMNLVRPTPYNRVLQCNQKKLESREMTTAWPKLSGTRKLGPNGQDHNPPSPMSSNLYVRSSNSSSSGVSIVTQKRHRIDSGFVRLSTPLPSDRGALHVPSCVPLHSKFGDGRQGESTLTRIILANERSSPRLAAVSSFGR